MLTSTYNVCTNNIFTEIPNKEQAAEAALVRRIFEHYADGQGLKAITNTLNKSNYKTKMGRAFSVTTIKGILFNPLYIGKIRYNKQQDWNTKRRKGTNPAPIIVDGEHEAIIARELWDKVQARYANANKHPARVYYGSFPFTGVMRCPQCGHGMVAQRATRKSKKTGEVKYTPYYQCGQFVNKGAGVCRANSVRAENAELEIMSRVQRLLDEPQLIKDVTSSMNSKDKEPLEQKLQRLEKELADVDRKKEKYFKLFESDTLAPDELKSKISELTETRLRLDKQISSIQRQISANNVDPVPVESVIGLLASFSAIFKNITHEKRKKLVHTLIKEITVTADRQIDKITLCLRNQSGIAPSNDDAQISMQHLIL